MVKNVLLSKNLVTPFPDLSLKTSEPNTKWRIFQRTSPEKPHCTTSKFEMMEIFAEGGLS